MFGWTCRRSALFKMPASVVRGPTTTLARNGVGLPQPYLKDCTTKL